MSTGIILASHGVCKSCFRSAENDCIENKSDVYAVSLSVDKIFRRFRKEIEEIYKNYLQI